MQLLKIFADDCKTFSKISTVNDHDRLQENLDELCENLDELCDWSNTWKLKFNATKCKVRLYFISILISIITTVIPCWIALIFMLP
jgi:hypothetical protein